MDNKPKALITGASSGIGKAFAALLASRGHDLVLVARRAAALEELAGQLSAAHSVKVEVIAADLANSTDVAKVEQRLAQGDVGMLVNNAGVGGMGAFLDSSLADIEQTIAVNVTALARLSQAAAAAMKAAGSGTIVNVASGMAFQVLPMLPVYSGSKAFVTQFTQVLQAELGGQGIRVQLLVPGLTRTNLGNAEETGFFDRFPAEIVQSPEAVAEACLAGLELGEEVCFPRLEDYSKWETAREAIQSVGRDPHGNKVASRYHVTHTS